MTIRIWAAIGLFTIYSAFLLRVGGAPARAELAAIRSAAESYRVESLRIAKEKNDANRKELDRVRADWDAYRLRHAAKAPSVTTRVCADAEGNRAVSDALQAYIGAVGEFRSSVEGLLADADRDRQNLSCAVEWAATINR